MKNEELQPPYKTILKDPPPEGYERTSEIAFIFDPTSTYENPYVLCQRWVAGDAWEWVQVPVVSVIDEPPMTEALKGLRAAQARSEALRKAEFLLD